MNRNKLHDKPPESWSWPPPGAVVVDGWRSAGGRLPKRGSCCKRLRSVLSKWPKMAQNGPNSPQTAKFSKCDALGCPQNCADGSRRLLIPRFSGHLGLFRKMA